VLRLDAIGDTVEATIEDTGIPFDLTIAAGLDPGQDSTPARSSTTARPAAWDCTWCAARSTACTIGAMEIARTRHLQAAAAAQAGFMTMGRKGLRLDGRDERPPSR
jgi:hypothetical protein